MPEMFLRDRDSIPHRELFELVELLRGAGLVSERRAGRFAHYRVDPEGLAPLHAWLARYKAFWPDRIDALKDLLKEMDQ